jgi:uncharacterized membrane protein
VIILHRYDELPEKTRIVNCLKDVTFVPVRTVNIDSLREIIGRALARSESIAAIASAEEINVVSRATVEIIETRDNFIFGFLGATIVVFISTRTDIMVLAGYISYYYFMGRIVNRPKYVTSLGKLIVFPIPSALGAFTGYKLAYIIQNLMT